MTWQAASFLILAIALAGGFAWYERSRPSAKVLALVASLAALAVVGRLAFAAFPNVKPTTDMVLLSGYALGSAPGFAVGAVTALVSNFFFTHGPWTPWQMAAWGGVGAAGAGLAWLARGRELSRWTLALVCGIAGFAFGAVMDTYQWTLAAEQTPAQWLAISATSLPYNVAHAAGNVVFCLVIGPAFLRALRRYRERFEVRWPAPAPATAAALVGALVLAGGLAAPEPAQASATSRALDYLAAAQNRDGGFGAARGQSSNQLHSGWSALGIAAAGRNPREFTKGGDSLLDYIRSGAGSLREVGDLERTILVARASALDPRDFTGRDLVAELLRFRRRNGSFSGFNSYTAFGVLALRAAGQRVRSPRVRRAARWLVRRQNRDGGWGVAPRSASDTDNTGAVLQALAAGGRRGHPAVRRAIRYLRRGQNRDGGFGTTPIRDSNSQSTAYAVMGLVAVRRNPARFGRRSPLAFLRSMQRRNGSVRYSRRSGQTPVWVTAQALLAFQRKPLPLSPAALARPSRAKEPEEAGARTAPRKKKRARKRRPAREARQDDESEPAPASPPVRQAAPPPAQLSPTAGPGRTGEADEGGGGSGPGAAIVVAALTGVTIVVAGMWWRRRRRSATA